jgi:hypothetical protein
MCVTSLGRPYDKIHKRRCQYSRQFKQKRESKLEWGHFEPIVPEQGILVNVTLGLPENFELADGSHHYDLAWLYDVVTTIVIASPSGFWLALAIPL